MTGNQVRKYESGASGISLERLVLAAGCLQRPVGFFVNNSGQCDANGSPDACGGFAMSDEARLVAASFDKITESEIRIRLMKLVSDLAKAD